MASTPPGTRGLSRRRLLRTSIAVGVGAGLVRGGGAEYATSDDTAEIVYAQVRSGGDRDALVPRRKTVPADWHASVQAAFDVQREIRESTLSSLVGSFVVPGSFDEPAASIAVDAMDEAVGDELADVAPDFEVDVTVWDEIPPRPDDPAFPVNPHRVADLDRRSVPGGVACRSPEMAGTLAPAAYDDRRGRRFFLTSNHVYGAGGAKETEHRGSPLDLSDGEDERTVGRVERGYPEADFTRIDPVDGYVPTPEIAVTEPARVVGQFTKIGLADLMAREVVLSKFGAFSGLTEGSVRGVDGFTCFIGEVCKPGQLKWGDERSITDGDSGSVNYAPDPENPEEQVIVGGINNARSWWPGADFTWGTAAFHLLEEYDVHF